MDDKVLPRRYKGLEVWANGGEHVERPSVPTDFELGMVLSGTVEDGTKRDGLPLRRSDVSEGQHHRRDTVLCSGGKAVQEGQWWNVKENRIYSNQPGFEAIVKRSEDLYFKWLDNMKKQEQAVAHASFDYALNELKILAAAMSDDYLNSAGMYADDTTILDMIPKPVVAHEMRCARCGILNEYADANRPDGTYVCFECR